MCKLPKYLFWLAILSCWPSMLLSAESYSGEDDTGAPAKLTLLNEPCTDKRILEAMHSRILDDRQFKSGTLFWRGRKLATCWIEQNGVVHSLDEEDSAFTPIPRAKFKDESI